MKSETHKNKSKSYDELLEAVKQYLSEFDNPVPDYGYRVLLRKRLRDLVTEKGEK